MTKIPWTDESWNPVTGCKKIAAGCRNCYAETMAKRFWGKRKFTDVQCHEDRLDIPLHWRKPRKIFVCSMSDLFHEDVSFEIIDQIHAVIALCPQHTFQILTKRIERATEYYMTRTAIDDSCRVDRMPQWYNVLTGWLDEGHKGYLGRNWDECEKAAEQTDFNNELPPNLWLGTSISTQADADKNIPILLKIPAAVRFLSLEPMLESICLSNYKIDQVIIGCESGPKRRPCKLEWIEDAVEQCVAASVPVFVKQLEIGGKVSKNPKEWPAWVRRQEYPSIVNNK